MISLELHAENLRALLSPITSLLDDETVSEILINGPKHVFAERDGLLARTGCDFGSERELLVALRAVAQYAGLELDERAPILEARLPDGSRIEAVVAPLASEGPVVAIRKNRCAQLSMDELVQLGSLQPDGKNVLAALVSERRNVLIAGGTGSGKTSLLSTLAATVPDAERIVVIEDAPEIALLHPHVVYLRARPADPQGHHEIGIRSLFRASLRLRPDRIVIGEIRGPEALDLVQAMTSGHGGCLSTIHATTPLDALARLETLALMAGLQLPLWALRTQVASAVHAIVQVERDAHGRRIVHEIAHVLPSEHGYELRDLYRTTADDRERDRSAR